MAESGFPERHGRRAEGGQVRLARPPRRIFDLRRVNHAGGRRMGDFRPGTAGLRHATAHLQDEGGLAGWGWWGILLMGDVYGERAARVDLSMVSPEGAQEGRSEGEDRMEIILFGPLLVLVAVIVWGMSAWAGLLKTCREGPEGAYRPGCSFVAAQFGLAGLLGGAFGVLWELRMPGMWLVGFVNLGVLAMLVSLPVYAVVAFICQDAHISKCVRSAFIGALIAAAATSSLWAWWSRPSRIIRMIREDLQLAELPASATNVKANAWSMGFGAAGYMMFKASAEDIEAFIASSPGVQGAEPYILGERHTEATDEEDFERALRDMRYEQLRKDRSAPRWFDPTIEGKGRMYEVRGAHHGDIIVNDATNTVYITVSWG